MAMITARSLIFAASAAIYLGAVAPGLAAGLTDDDFVFLTAYNVERTSPLIVSLSPKEQSRLHSLINDTRTATNSVARARDVSDALTTFKKNQLWEQEHPGQLWDDRKQ